MDRAVPTRACGVRGSEATPPSRLCRVIRGGADGGGMLSSPPDPARDDSSSEALVDGGEVNDAFVHGHSGLEEVPRTTASASGISSSSSHFFGTQTSTDTAFTKARRVMRMM